MMEFIKAVILGIIQGITEWLPISSTGHMILFNDIWPMEMSEDFVNLFLVVIQFGSILAVIVRYFSKLWPFSRKKTPEQRKDTWSLWGKILIGIIPAGILGVLFDDWIDEHLYGSAVVAVMLIVYGILFLIVEDRGRDPKVKTTSQLTYLHALAIGAFQALALIPGTSRSGATILGGIWTGCARTVAAEFSFFMAIPTMFGASALKLAKFVLKTGVGLSGMEWGILGTGMVVAFVVSLFAIGLLMNYIRKHDFKVFGWYRIVLGIVVLGYFLFLK
ncbi:MAG: undecaprenyl-diphosphate phosphatase [Erysipelotrichales bacterium]|nr:undecaprenyl-diphosphate phosphatase [Erysipelotrichales bacterium]